MGVYTTKAEYMTSSLYNEHFGDNFQGRSQNYIEGVLNSTGLCSVDTDSLTKHLVTKENLHHPVYDYSHYTVKNHLLATCAL